MTIHFSMQGLVSTIVVRFCYPGLRPQSMTWKYYFRLIVPTVVATALDIDLSNVALIFILVTFSTMCFRWTVTQILLQKEEYGLTNPFAVMSYLTPLLVQ